MRKTIIILLLIIGLYYPLSAQYNRGVWQGSPIIRSGPLLMWITSEEAFSLLNFYYVDKNYPYRWHSEMMEKSLITRWAYPVTYFDFHIPNWKLLQDGTEQPLQGPKWWKCLLFGDFKHDYQFALGYKLTYRSFDIPFALSAGVNYEWRGVYVKSGTYEGLHRTSGVVPSADLRWNVLGLDFERTNRWNIVAQASLSYAMPITYKGPLANGKEILGGGLRPALSLGYRINRYEMKIQYEWDCYNYINQPGLESKIQTLSFYFSHIL